MELFTSAFQPGQPALHPVPDRRKVMDYWWGAVFGGFMLGFSVGALYMRLITWPERIAAKRLSHVLSTPYQVEEKKL